MKERLIDGVFVLLYSAAITFVICRVMLFMDGDRPSVDFIAPLFASILGILYTVFAAYLAAMAEQNAEKASDNSQETITKLLEQQIITRGIGYETYFEVLDEHMYAPVRVAKEAKVGLADVKLLISTPSYGSPPEPFRADMSLPWLINSTSGKCEMILFSPDAHYIHWANILLAQGLANDTNAKDFLYEFLLRIETTLSLIRSLTETKSRLIHVWATYDAPIRMTYFRYEGSAGTDARPRANDSFATRSFLILTDSVRIDSPLDTFYGRCIGLPADWLESFVEEEDSFFEQFKLCPYTRKTGESSVLAPEELLMLTEDLCLGRTWRPRFEPYDIADAVTSICQGASNTRETSRNAFLRGCTALRKFVEDRMPDELDRSPFLRTLLDVGCAECEVGAATEAEAVAKIMSADFAAAAENPYHAELVRKATALFAEQVDNLLWIPPLSLLLGAGYSCSKLAAKRTVEKQHVAV